MPDEFEIDDELAELRALSGRVGSEPVAWQSPPDDLWARIAEGAGVSDTEPSDTGPTDTDEQPERPTEDPGGTVLPMRPARGSTPWFLAAAAVVVVVVGIAFVGFTGDDDAQPTLVAASDLDLLDTDASGRAELIDDGGRLRLRVDMDEIDPDDGFLEVWVIDTEVTQLISLGPVRADGIYDLPPTIDPRAFPIVDVSIEPLDGDPTHSGNSVLRGQLPF